MENKKLDYFIKIINQMLVLTTAGIGSAIAFLQIQELSIDASRLYFYCIISWVVALPIGAFAYIVLANMAEDEKPNFDSCVVRYPSLFTALLFILGIVLFLLASYKQYSHRYGANEKKQSVECRSDVVLSPDNSQYKHLTVDQKVLLDAFVEKVFPAKNLSTPDMNRTLPLKGHIA